MGVIDQARFNYDAVKNFKDETLPADSNRWTLLRQDMREAIEAFNVSDPNIGRAIISYAQCDAQFDHRHRVENYEHLYGIYRSIIGNDYKEFQHVINVFSDSPFSDPTTIADMENASIVSNIMFCHASYVMSALRFDNDINKVCEIGGGYGGPAMVWLTNPIKKIQSYTIIDLPESLFFAEVFLKQSCPDINVVYCKSESDLSNNSDDTVYLVPMHLASQTKNMNFDLICNTGSMGEISDEWILYWKDWLGGQQCDQFYSLNYFGRKPTKQYESRNIISPLVDNKWRVGSLRLTPPLLNLQSPDRDYAEVIFIRDVSTRDPAWIYEVWKLQKSEKLTLSRLAYFLFNLPADAPIDIETEIDMYKKSVSDLSYMPTETIYLSKRILSSEMFSEASPESQNFVREMHEKLYQDYNALTPSGRMYD